MATVESVGVSMTLKDNISDPLKKVCDLMDKIVDKVSYFSDNAKIATKQTRAYADQLERVVSAYADLNAYGRIKLASVPRNVGNATDIRYSNDPSIKNMKSDSKFVVAALKGAQSDVDKLYKRFQAIPQNMDYSFSGLSEHIKRVVTDIDVAYNRGVKFASELNKINLSNPGTFGEGQMTAILQAQDSYKRKLAEIKELQEKFDRDSIVSVEDTTKFYGYLASAIKDAKIAHEQMTNVMKTASLSEEQVSQLKTEYELLINPIHNAVKALSKFGDISDEVLKNPELKKAIEDYNKLQTELEATAKAEARARKESKELAQSQTRVNREAKSAANSVDKFNKKIYASVDASGKAVFGLNSLGNSLKTVAATYVGLESIKTAVNWSDELTLTQGKLAQLTDDVEGFMRKTYQMSQDTRTSYMDNASQMAKMWQLTGGINGVFDSEEKLLEFNELLNKSFILGGSGVREINASIYQLTQALSSGRLQGDELRSLAENAPYLINAVVDSVEKMYNAGKPIDEQIKLTYNDLKKLGAEGVLTADVIVDAVLNSADKIRDAYENITPTWEQTFQKLKNQIQYISQPILESINEIINSDAFEKTAQTIVKIFTVILSVINPLLQAVLWLGSAMADNWSLVEPIIWGIVGALAAYLGYMALAKVYTIALGTVQGIQLLISNGVGYSMVKNNVALGIYNTLAPIATVMTKALAAAETFLAGATWAALAPLLTVVAVIAAVVAVIYLSVEAYNRLTDSTVSATGVIVGAFYGLYATVYDVFAGIWNILVEVAEFFANVFNDPVYYAKSLFGGLVKAVLKMFKGMGEGINKITVSIAKGIESLVNGAIDMINGMIGAYNSTAGTIFGKLNTVGKVNLEGKSKIDTSGIDKAISGIDSWIGVKESKDVSFDEYKAEYKDISKYYNKGYAKGQEWADNVTEVLDGYSDSLVKYIQPNISGNSVADPTLMETIDQLKGNTDDIVNNTKVSSEELKYLRDIAERDVINRFTTAEIKIENNMNNNINSDRDLDGIVNYITTEMYKAASSTAEGLHY